MKHMKTTSLAWTVLTLAMLVSGAVAEDKSALLNFLVVRDYNGKLRVQVLATGFQTFGDDYDIDQPVEEITVKMKRPQGQYSIYEDHPTEKKDEKPQK